MQRTLGAEQVAAFYHSEFVQQQVEHFKRLLPEQPVQSNQVVLDIGGGGRLFRARTQARAWRSGASDRY